MRRTEPSPVLRRIAIALAAGALCGAPAFAAEPGWGSDIEVMADDELGELRGGIAITPDINVNFGATITTFVNGMPALSTQLTWNTTGAFVEQTVGEIGERIDDMTREERQALGVEGLSGGVVIDDADGVTALVHNVTEGALQNVILNTASGRDLRQEIDVTLELPGFEAVQDSLILERIGIHIADDMSAAAIGN